MPEIHVVEGRAGNGRGRDHDSGLFQRREGRRDHRSTMVGPGPDGPALTGDLAQVRVRGEASCGDAGRRGVRQLERRRCHREAGS